MLGDKQDKQKDFDALDPLRRWIGLNNFQYGSLRPKLTIKKGVIVTVTIQQGDKIDVLEAGDLR